MTEAEEEESNSKTGDDEMTKKSETVPNIAEFMEHRLKMDHFEGIHVLPEDAPKIDGAPNFRQVGEQVLNNSQN